MDERSSLGTVSTRGCVSRNARARNNHVEATLNHPCPAQDARLIGAELLRDARAAPTAHELEFKLAHLGIVESALLSKETQRDSALSDDDDDD